MEWIRSEYEIYFSIYLFSWLSLHGFRLILLAWSSWVRWTRVHATFEISARCHERVASTLHRQTFDATPRFDANILRITKKSIKNNYCRFFKKNKRTVYSIQHDLKRKHKYTEILIVRKDDWIISYFRVVIAVLLRADYRKSRGI